MFLLHERRCRSPCLTYIYTHIYTAEWVNMLLSHPRLQKDGNHSFSLLIPFFKKKKNQHYLILFLWYWQMKMLTEWVTDSPTATLLTGVRHLPAPDIASAGWMSFTYVSGSHIQGLVVRRESSLPFIPNDSTRHCAGLFPSSVCLEVSLRVEIVVMDAHRRHGQYSVRSAICRPLWVTNPALFFPSFNICFIIHVNFYDYSKDNKSWHFPQEG